MLQEMTWEQFMMWRDYDLLEPFGEERADLRSGTIASVIANAHSGKNSKKFTAMDFMPKFDTVKEPLTDPGAWKDVLSMAKSVAMAKEH